MVFFAGIVLVQGVMFGADFVFRDGVDGAKRDACIENNTVLATVYTTRDNAENLQELPTGSVPMKSWPSSATSTRSMPVPQSPSVEPRAAFKGGYEYDYPRIL